MRKFWRLSARAIAVGLICWLLTSSLLAILVQNVGWWWLKSLLFLCLVLLPGVALLRLLRITPRTISVGILYSFGLGILVLMISGLLANQILPLFGVVRPLEFWWSLGAWSNVTAIIIALGILRNKSPLKFKKWLPQNISRHVWVLVVVSLLLLSISVAGAFRLNNGGDGLFAMIALGIATGLIIYTFLLRRRLPEGILVWLIFSMSLTILLMTSLRGWDIMGHDIEREFRVFTLTHMHGLWNIGLDRDPYNACLSITILPEILSRLMDVSGLVIFKVVLQIVFAACPAVIYVLLRHYMPKLAALTGCLLFICYPTFINDSAMLTRQGVAYLFFALALLVLINKTQDAKYKILFVLCSMGAILSHYSTAYMFVALFAVAVLCKLLVTWWRSYRRKPLPQAIRKSVLSPFFAIFLFALTFAWYTQVTETSSGLFVTIKKSLSNIPEVFSSDNRSSDTSTALLFASNKTQADLYQSYLTNTQPRTEADATKNLQYIPTLVDDSLPLTLLGEKARSIGIDPSIITTLRQNFAKVLQVLAVLGVLYATYRLLRRKRPDTFGTDFTCLGLAGIALLALLVVLPVLSINYGVLRAFQQALIFLLLPMMLLLVEVGRRINLRAITVISTTGIVLLFLLFTGMFAQLLGGVSPSLSMNNQGLYYGLYAAPEADARSYAWMKAHIGRNQDVRVANFNRALMHDPKYPFTRSGILPSQIESNTYVYLDQAQVETQKVYAYYESSPLIMTFPLDYYDQSKNLIYSTASTRVYR